MFQKIKLYFTYIVTAFLIVMTLGILKYVSEARSSIFLIAVPIISGAIYFLNFRSIYNSVMGYSKIRKNKPLILISIIILLLLSISNIGGNIYNFIQLKKIGYEISTFNVISISIAILYLIFLIEILLKVLRGNKNTKIKNFDNKDFNCLKLFEEKINTDSLVKGSEIKLDRINFKTYQPKLVNKIEEENDTLIEYSNEEDVSFLILIRGQKELYTKFLTKNSNSRQINLNIINFIEKLTNANNV